MQCTAVSGVECRTQCACVKLLWSMRIQRSGGLGASCGPLVSMTHWMCAHVCACVHMFMCECVHVCVRVRARMCVCAHVKTHLPRLVQDEVMEPSDLCCARRSRAGQTKRLFCTCADLTQRPCLPIQSPQRHSHAILQGCSHSTKRPLSH